MPPDQLCLDRLEERLNSRIIVAITFARHRYLEPMLAQDLLIVMRTVLRPAIRVVDAASGRYSERNCHFQRTDRQIPLHPIADRPANHATRMQVEDHGKIQPAFARPDIADVACPFLVLLICNEVSVQQIWCNVELMVAVPLSADCFAIACRAMVVTLCLRVLITDMPF